MKVSRSGYDEWRDRPPSKRDLEDAYLANTIVDIHAMSRCSYGIPPVHAELRLGMGVRVGGKRVARLLRMVGRRGISHRHKWRHRPAAAVRDDLVQRRFGEAGKPQGAGSTAGQLRSSCCYRQAGDVRGAGDHAERWGGLAPQEVLV